MKIAALLLLAVAPLPSFVDEAAAADNHEIVSFGKEVVVPAGKTVREVVSIGGPVRIDGNVERGVVSVGGPASINGRVGDDLVVIGSVTLGPKAVVDGEFVVVGGEAHVDPAAKINGERTTIAWDKIPAHLPAQVAAPLSGVAAWFAAGPARGSALPLGVPWVWWATAAFLLAYAGLAFLAPAPVEACAKILAAQPVQALVAGILLLSLLGPVTLFFVVTVVGIALLPAVAGLLMIGLYVGKAAVLRAVGGRVGEATGRAPQPAVAVLIGGALLALVCAAPFVGVPVWALATAWGLGAATLAALEAMSGSSSSSVPAAASASAPAAPPAAASVELPRASFGLRLAATAIDVVACGVLAGLAPVLTFGIGAWAVYQIGLWTWKGTTLGGIVVGVRGVRLDGRPMDLTVAAVRHLASYFSAFACFLGFLWAAWDPESQTWHDKIAGTVVVRVPKAEPLV